MFATKNDAIIYLVHGQHRYERKKKRQKKSALFLSSKKRDMLLESGRKFRHNLSAKVPLHKLATLFLVFSQSLRKEDCK